MRTAETGSSSRGRRGRERRAGGGEVAQEAARASRLDAGRDTAGSRRLRRARRGTQRRSGETSAARRALAKRCEALSFRGSSSGYRMRQSGDAAPLSRRRGLPGARRRPPDARRGSSLRGSERPGPFAVEGGGGEPWRAGDSCGPERFTPPLSGYHNQKSGTSAAGYRPGFDTKAGRRPLFEGGAADLLKVNDLRGIPLATQEALTQRRSEPGVSASDPRRTMRAPFPRRSGAAQDLKRETERVRAELTRGRLPTGSNRVPH